MIPHVITCKLTYTHIKREWDREGGEEKREN